MRYLSYYRLRSVMISLSVGMLAYLPFGLQRLIDQSREKLLERAVHSDLVICSEQGGTDDVVEALYLKSGNQQTWMEYGMLEELHSTGLGYPIPLLTGFHARSYPIVGTHVDYFPYRKLELGSGVLFRQIGECVIGSAVAEQLSLTVGDSLISSSQGFFDLSGIYPLKLTITGILQPSDSPDDRGVFTDIKTTWIIMGLGHGHEDLEEIDDPSLIMNREDNNISATARLKLYQEINPENRTSFHFHGNLDDLPIRSVLFVPQDEKSLTILRGRFESGEFRERAYVPVKVVEQILLKIFRLQEVFFIIYTWVAAASMIILFLIFALLIKLRQQQLRTLFILGASRFKVAGTLLIELVLLSVMGGFAAILFWLATGFFTDVFINNVIL